MLCMALIESLYRLFLFLKLITPCYDITTVDNKTGYQVL